MALYLLYESVSGYALFLAHGIDEIGQSTEAVRNSVTDLNRFGKVVKLVAFTPFESAVDALNQCNAISEVSVLCRLSPPSSGVFVGLGLPSEMEIDSNSGENPLLNESEEVEEPKRGMFFSSKQEGHVINAIGDTSLTPASVDIMRRQSFMNVPTQIYGVGTSLTPSDCIGGTPGFMRTQQSITATHQICGAVSSSFVDLNVQMDRNDRGSFRYVIDYYTKKSIVANLHAEKPPKDVTAEVQK
ncbi:unnamed protein product [Camellia sinensis]